MDAPLSETLKAAREARGLTLEDAAHATRIPVPRLRQLETGNYAAFGNMAYARGFIRLYGRYLDVDAQEFSTGLPDPVLGGPSDYRYLTESYGPWIGDRRASDKVNLSQGMPSPIVYTFLLLCFVGVGSAIFAHNFLLKPAVAVESVVKPAIVVQERSAEPVLAVSKVSTATGVPVGLDRVPVRRAIPVVEEYRTTDESAKP
ncbi:MAG: helix-turn-helix domain-containing protein [Verrucomicrobiaceae bacterium]|jgi:cytoskeletal protein RodZ